MSPEVASILVSIGTILTAIISSVLTYRATQNRLKEDRAEIMAGASEGLANATEKTIQNFITTLKRVEDDYEKCRQENKEIKAFVDKLYDGIKQLIKQLEDQGVEPVWYPPPRINGWRTFRALKRE